MKRFVCIILIVSCFLLIVACTPLFSSENTVRDPKKYMQVDPYVQEELDLFFTGFLMEKNNINPELADYYYHYTPKDVESSFIVHLVYRFESEASFEQEWSRIVNLAEYQKQIGTYRIMYSANSASENIQAYLDDEIYDGRSFYFEFALVDQSSMTITYLSALVQDNQAQENVVLELINLWSSSKTGDNTVS